jgi:hypothetical protein
MVACQDARVYAVAETRSGHAVELLAATRKSGESSDIKGAWTQKLDLE